MKTLVVVALCVGGCAVLFGICSSLRAHAKFRQLIRGTQSAVNSVQYLEFRGQGRVLRVTDFETVQAIASKMSTANRFGIGNNSGFAFSLVIGFKGIFQAVTTFAYIPEGAVTLMIAVPMSAFSARDPDYYTVTFIDEPPPDLVYLSHISNGRR